MNALWSLLSEVAAERGTKPFVTDLRSKEVISYETLLLRSTSASVWLASRKVNPGDRVAYITKNDPAFFPLLFGCAIRGAALVPINADNDPAEIRSVLDDCGASVVLCDKPASEDWMVPGAEVFENTGSADVAECAAEQDAIIIYTSGTTGRSKGVVLSHKNLIRMARTLASVYHYRPGQRFLSMLPNYHINAPVVTGLSCIAGRTHVFVTDIYGFTNARLIFPFVETHELEVLSITPSIMASLLKFNPGGTDCNLSSAEFGLVGTAHLNEKLWKHFEKTFGFPCYQGYGLTETTTWATMTPPDERKRYDSAGVPIGAEIMIDDESGGEVLIRGDIVMNRYHQRKALTRKQFKNGWFRTGDIGRIDDGQLFITGRIKNIIKRRGILISPEEIDEVLRRFPHTSDACTVGVPDELFGERIISACAIDDAQLEGLKAHMRNVLSAYKYPDEFLAVGEIPRNDMGKPDLEELRKMVTGEKAKVVVKSFDAYRFRRARSKDMPVIEQLIHHALLKATTVEFVGFWGAGTRAAVAEPDVVAMDRLRALLDAIAGAAGRDLATMNLILADIHARCNQVPPGVYESYFAAIASLAEERSIQTTWLSTIWESNEIRFEHVLNMMRQNEKLEEWESFELRDEFRQQALRRCADEAIVEEYAYRYFLTVATENPVVATSFRDSVFFTYNGPEFRPALPRLPMVHLHSIKPGTAAKPWFLAG